MAEMKQDRLRFKHLVKSCETELTMKFDELTALAYLKALKEIEEDDDFWLSPSEGLAIFVDQKQAIVYKLQVQVEPLAIVADSFHIKPLHQVFQFNQKVIVLGIDAENFMLFEGNRFGFNAVPLDKNAPTTLEAAIGVHKAESYLSRGSYGGTETGMFHGHGGRKDEKEKTTEKFFRFVDNYVLENYSKESKAPIILLALNEHHSVFQSLSKNPYLLKEGIKGNFKDFDLKQLKTEVNALLEPLNNQKLLSILERYRASLSESKGSDRIAEITKAALEGRIEILLIEENKIILGKINPRNQKVEFGDTNTKLLDDVLDDLAEQVLRYKGEVYLYPKAMFESKFGVGAIFRY